MEITPNRLPSLVQRVRFRKSASKDVPEHVHNDRKRKGIDAFFEFDYMGASEFEWGALPKSLKIMRTIRTKDWKPEKLQVGPYAIYYVGHPDDKVTAEALFADQLLERPQSYTKERTRIRESYGIEKPYSIILDVFDGWWAVDGGRAASFRDQDIGFVGKDGRPFILFRKEEHAKIWLREM